MYGTIARLKVRKDKVREFFALGKEWADREQKRAFGYLGGEILWEDEEEGRACLVVRFSSRESYIQNANSRSRTPSIGDCARASRRTRSGSTASTAAGTTPTRGLRSGRPTETSPTLS